MFRVCVPLTLALQRYGRLCWLLEQHAEGLLPSLRSANCTGTRYRAKRDTHWLGDMVHCTEICERTKVSLITHVHPIPATVHNAQCTALLQEAVAQRQRIYRTARYWRMSVVLAR